MKQSIFKIQIIQTIFVVALFVIAQLQKNSIIGTSKSLMTLYGISIFIYWMIICIIILVIMHKNEKKEKKIFLNMVLISIELIILGIFCGNVDYKIDRMEFSKHCKETIANIYYVSKDVDWKVGKGVVNGQEYFATTYTYFFRYYAEEEEYESKFYTSTEISYSSELMARHEAEKVKPEYSVGDEITIYYNTENPEDWRRDIVYTSENFFIITTVIMIVLRVLGLSKAIIDSNSIKKMANKI